MFITTFALLCYGILYFDISSLSSYIFHLIPSFNSSYIFLFIAARHSSSLKADCHAIHRAALCTDDNFFDYNPISSQVFQWWYSFGWLCHDKSMYNVYNWYKTHAVISLWSPTDYYLFHHVLRIHSSTFASVLSWIHISSLITLLLYIILLLLFYPDICPSCFTLLLAYHKPGEGRVLSRTHIWDSYPWLRSETYKISDQSIKLNNRDW